MSTPRVTLHARPRAAVEATDGLSGASRRLIDRKLAAAHAAGVEEGSVKGMEGAAQALSRAADHFEEFIENAQGEVAAFAVELAVDIAGHLLRRELNRGDFDIEKLVRNTLAASKVGRGQCVVHLCPADHARLAGVPFRTGTNVVPDPDIATGNVQVETPQGLLVHDRDEALVAIRTELLGHLT